MRLTVSTFLSLVAALTLLSPSTAFAEAGYGKGFTITQHGEQSYCMTVNALLQASYRMVMPDEGDTTAAFSLHRVRFTTGGYLISEDLHYKFQLGFDHGDAALMDYMIDYNFGGDVHIRVGQWRKPFSRQHITSAAKLGNLERAITDRYFGAGRDVGLTLHNNYEKSPTVEWAVGVYNGTPFKGSYAATTDGTSVSVSRSNNTPTLFKPMVAGRIGYNHGKVKGYDEIDLDGGGLRFAVAASVLGDFDVADNGDEGNVNVGVDYILKVAGFTTSGAFYLINELGDGSVPLMGFHVDANYVANRSVIVPTVRFASLMYDDPAKLDRMEFGGGVGVLFADKLLKWQTQFTAYSYANDTVDYTDFELRTQLTSTF